jgi:hypothetical protein
MFLCFAYIHFSHFNTENENETWKAVKFTFYALLNVILRLIHFRRSEGQATRMSEGQQHHFYTKRLESSAKFRDFLWFLFLGRNCREVRTPEKRGMVIQHAVSLLGHCCD